jgi:photosystem II stability/assembly factor-like uncharacterized protein
VNRHARSLVWLAALGAVAAVAAGAVAVAAGSPAAPSGRAPSARAPTSQAPTAQAPTAQAPTARAPTGRLATQALNPPWRPCTSPAILAAGEAVPGWRLGAIDFLSAEVGVGLTAARVPCLSRVWAGGIDVGVERQTVLVAVTEDGGRSWLSQGTPLPSPSSGSLVEQVAASSVQNVWASTGAGRLMATANAGASWTVQPVPGPVAAVAVTRRALWALGCPHRNNVQCAPVLARKTVPNGRWRRLPLPEIASDPYPLLTARPGRVIVVQGEPAGNTSDEILTSADGGLNWRAVADPSWMGRPCQVADLASAGREGWWLICLGGAAAGSSTKALLHTTDAGRTWRIASQVKSLTEPWRPGSLGTGEPNAMAAGSPSRLWLCFQNSVAESDDAGRSWTGVPGVNPQGNPAAFDVLSPTHAWLLATGQGLWRTTDGRRWRAL